MDEGYDYYDIANADDDIDKEDYDTYEEDDKLMVQMIFIEKDDNIDYEINVVHTFLDAVELPIDPSVL